MGKCIVIGASGEAYWDKRWFPDAVICADGGVQTAIRLGLKPDVWIGDADSSTPVSGVKNIEIPARKDFSDLEACLNYGLDLGMSEFALTGCTGGRLDHFLSNVYLLELLADNKAEAVILNRENEISVYSHPIAMPPPHCYRYLSILPLDKTISGVSVTGVRYPLDNAVLRRASSYSVSNEPLPEQTVKISIQSGSAVIIRSELKQFNP